MGTPRSTSGFSQHPPPQKRFAGGLLMTEDDINFVLRIQFAATHGGSPYVEDYYHQAYLYKYSGGRNAAIFVPDSLRSLDGSNTQQALDSAPHAELSGLGKFVLSNIRTPKMLMDLGGSSNSSSGDADATSNGKQGASQQKLLEQEPLLAARIMIEDCMDFLLDIDDVDRLLAVNGGRAGNAAGLRSRRATLLGSILNSFQLPDSPEGASSTEAGSGQQSLGDGVLQQVAALPKGRALLAKTLRLLFTGPSHGSSGSKQAGGRGGQPSNGHAANSSSSSAGLPMVWALLRHAPQLFGPAMSAARADARVIDSTVSLSEAVAEVLKRVQQPSEAVQCLAAFNAALHPAGDAEVAAKGSARDPLLPLYPAGRVAADASPLWLDHVLAALLLRASELGLGSFAAQADEEGGVGGEVAEAWQQQLSLLYSAYINHLQALAIMVQQEQQVTADSAQLVKKLASPMIMRGLLAHCSKEEEEQLRGGFAAAAR
jgi:DNA topoisomerase 2-associated protein PAT1